MSNDTSLPVLPPFVSIILAGGKGTRMNVPYPKVLTDIHGKTLVEYAVAVHEKLGAQRIIVVTGYKGELVRDTLGDRVEYVHQEEQLGTGHAVLTAEPLLKDWDGAVLIAMGDMPFLTPDMFQQLLMALEAGADCAVLGVKWPEGKTVPVWGRFLRTEDGRLAGIVEQKDATDEQQTIRELNVNAYAVRAKDLFLALHQTSQINAQKEYYLTDIVSLLRKDGKQVVPVLTHDADRVVGINTPEELEEAREVHLHRHVGPEHPAA